MVYLVLGLLLFLGVHSVRIVAEGWRTQAIARLGAQRWKGLYSLASLAGLGLIIWGEVPTWWVLLGAVLVVVSSLYIAHRETRLGRAAARRPAGTLAVPIEGGVTVGDRPRPDRS